VLIAIAGPPGLAGAYAYHLGEDGDVVVYAVSSGSEVARWRRGEPPRFAEAAGVPVAMRMLDDTTLVEVTDDATLATHDLAAGTQRRVELAATRVLLPNEVDIGDDRVVFVDGGAVVTADLKDGAVLDELEVEGQSCSGSIPDESSHIDLSDDGRSLGVVRCDAEGRGSLYVARSLDPAASMESVALRHEDPTAVSVAAGGTTAAVAFFLGQIDILRDGDWFEPNPLRTERAGHNQYQPGWVALDQTGRMVVTRRDAADVELWVLEGTSIERIGRLANDLRPPAPAFAQFGRGSPTVTLGWDSFANYDSTQTVTAITATWMLDRATIVGLACAELGAVPEHAGSLGVTELDACVER
jgi:hypothetical protein